jgi:hypothetical protein
LSPQIDQQVSTRPWWRRVNPTLIALVIAISAVAVLGWRSADAPRKSAPTSAEPPAAAPRHKLEPRAVVGALLPKHHRRQRAHAKKKASRPASTSEKQSARP